MVEHVLLTHAKRRPYRQVPILPESASYDRARGYWVSDNSPIVEALPPSDTKKCDQETGEDQKGE